MYRANVSARYIAKIRTVTQPRNRVVSSRIPTVLSATRRPWVRAASPRVRATVARRRRRLSAPPAKYDDEPNDDGRPVPSREEAPHVGSVDGGVVTACATRVRTRRDLVATARECGEFRVCGVEVCQGYAWNHLTVSYVLGNGEQPRIRRVRPFGEVGGTGPPPQ
ncbi:DUF5318 family protein [Thermomonospora umbrina]|uniref:DUF5318 family protein n=1 Tax=Thermomonospora umbrina TaxID=111806 RepID=UPI0014771845|nr:DUF5318 family protein [Thermomonospora umbrina]